MDAIITSAMLPHISHLLTEAERREAEDILFDMEAKARGYVPERMRRIKDVRCTGCDGKLVVHENGASLGGDTIIFAYDVYCDKCSKRTPLFSHRIDAIKYYAKEHGITYEYID